MPAKQTASFIDSEAIASIRASAQKSTPDQVRQVLDKARLLKGLDATDMAILMENQDPKLCEEMFSAARWVKEKIYGTRIVMFAPLYISNLCQNECLYCAFRARNKELKRRTLTQKEIEAEVAALIDQGHKRILLVAGESDDNLDFVIESIQTIYKTHRSKGNIRRVNVNLAPLDVKQFKKLKAAHIGTYQLFQETYHRETYTTVHVGGIKRDYDWRLTAPDRAMEAGIDDLGVGILFGLYDWKYELLALRQHIDHLEKQFGVGPHTISVPRMEPAMGSNLAAQPGHPVSDEDFKRIIAILRLTVPYTGIILSTRESIQTRKEALALGVSQISAGSRTDPGGYSEAQSAANAAQFQLGDHRSLEEVVQDLTSMNYLPSFCTACYRMGRTGKDFMDLAKPGLIRRHCDPNAISTFEEYLMNFASEETRAKGQQLTHAILNDMDGPAKQIAQKLLEQTRAGKRDSFV